MAKTAQPKEDVYAGNRKAWREWLEKHHDSSPSVWLVLDKKDGAKARLTYAEAVEEALCFGWVDSVPNKLDDKQYRLMMSPRKPKSVWSKINKERIERLIKDGLMTDAGMKKIEAAKADGSWGKLDASDSLTIPDELQKALNANKTAKANFEAFSPSVKKQILEWVHAAKRPETLQKRIEETVAGAAENRQANNWRQAQKAKEEK